MIKALRKLGKRKATPLPNSGQPQKEGEGVNIIINDEMLKAFY